MNANRDRSNRPTKHSPAYYAAKRKKAQTPPRWSLTIAKAAKIAAGALVAAAVLGWIIDNEPTYSQVRIIAGEAYVIDHGMSAQDCHSAITALDVCERE